jgi:dihydrofolate reductase
MAKIVAIEHLTLDGVYQAPGRANEDERGGFTAGGWAASDDSPELSRLMAAYMQGGWSLLIGSTTYAGLYQSWPILQPDSPMTKALTAVEKFVVSRNVELRLPWSNSTLVAGDGVQTVAQLKGESDKPLIIFGSGVLTRSLMANRLVDEFFLMIHPLVLGQGLRLFDETAPGSALKLADSRTLPTGVIAATYTVA